MKIPLSPVVRIITWLTLGGALYAPAHAASPEIISLGLAGRRVAISDLAVESGSKLVIDLLIPAGLALETASVELLQLGGSLAAPVVRPRPLVDFLTGDSKPPSTGGMITLSLDVPTVERPVGMVLRFSEPSRAVLGQVRLAVFPTGNPEEEGERLNRLLKKSGQRLVVFGENRALRTFFTVRKINFSDAGREPPEIDENGFLYLGDLSRIAWDRRNIGQLAVPAGRWLVFVSDPTLFPGVYMTNAPSGTVAKVTLPLADSLVDDPRSRELFLHLIESMLSSAPVAAL